ncbi:TlyA family rRNA (cytidine-2'-O)-methyltransferase [Candidatus Daviesbacteria bacterium]|nr:TlyA family rRNA (cytidine-2'-O)-methyltransferase [Candidatus Daviesbacteria bacterium]
MASDKFVSRGGEKLEAAIKKFLPAGRQGKLKIENLICLDVGSSTGGFVDCLLQNGAKKVYAVDTCYGELAWTLRNDPRVVVMERTNILHLYHLPGEKNALHLEGEETKVDLITIDAGWTRLELILPVVQKFLKPDGKIIALLKPHYEAPKNILVKGVVPPESVENITHRVCQKIKDLGFKIYDQMESPILGGAGNREYLLLLKL